MLERKSVSISCLPSVAGFTERNLSYPFNIYKVFDTFNPFHFQSELTHKMLGPEFSAQLEQLRLATLQVFPQPCVQPLLTPDGFQSLFALIGRNGQGVATSPFGKWVKKTDKIR